MFATAALLLPCIWSALTAAHVTPPPPGADAGMEKVQTFAVQAWTPTCKLPAISNVYLSVGHGGFSGCVNSNGTLQGFMLFVDFSDTPATAADTQALASLYASMVPKTNAFYNDISYGALELNITADTSAYYRMPASAASYKWTNGFTWEQHQSYVQDALDAYTKSGARPAPAHVDVLYVVPIPRSEPYISRSITTSFTISSRQGKSVATRAVTLGAATWDLMNTTLSHETGHTLCMPDLYPVDGSGRNGLYVGGYNTMGDTSGIAPDFFAWDKWRLGWLSDRNVDCVLNAGTTEHTLSSMATATGVKAVVVARNQTSALVAEVRVPEGPDGRVCAPGVLLYTLDTSVSTGYGPYRVIDAKPRSGGCGNDEINDGSLSLKGTSSYTVPGWGVTVTVLSQVGDNYTIQVKYSK